MNYLNQPPLIKSVIQTAELFGFSKDFLYKEVKAGNIEYVRKGRHLGFTNHQIRKYIEEHETSGTKSKYTLRRFGRGDKTLR